MEMQFVFLMEGKDYGKLKELLAADPYERNSFVVAGYVLKESKAMGLKGGSYVLYFKTLDEEVAKKLKERLKACESAKELEGGEKEKIVKQIEDEENAAASGFGSIFG